jgi:hypothetical protein
MTGFPAANEENGSCFRPLRYAPCSMRYAIFLTCLPLSETGFLDSPNDPGSFLLGQELKGGANNRLWLAAEILQGDFHAVMHVYNRITVKHLG